MRKKPGILVFDFGTSKLRASVINPEDGRFLYCVAAPYKRLADGRISPEFDFWETAQNAAGAAAEFAKAENAEITALSFSWFGANLAVFGKHGDLLMPVILSFEDFAEDEAKRLKRQLPASVLKRVPRGGINGQSIPAKILHLKEHPAEVLSETEKTYDYCSVQQYILGKLGFDNAWDKTIASTTQYFDPEKGIWDKQITELLGIEDICGRRKVFESGNIIGYTDRFGKVSLGRKIPVIIGGHDCEVAQLGLGLCTERPGLLADIAGTFDLMCYFRDGYRLFDAEGVDTLAAPCKGSFAVMAGEPCGQIISDFLEKKGIAKEPDVLEKLFGKADFAETKDELLFNPKTESFPEAVLNAPAEEGFSAVVKSVTLMQRDCFLKLQSTSEAPFSQMRIAGGGSRSDSWIRLKAELFNIPVRKSESPEASSIGAAVLAAAGTGEYGSIPEAQGVMCRLGEIYEA